MTTKTPKSVGAVAKKTPTKSKAKNVAKKAAKKSTVIPELTHDEARAIKRTEWKMGREDSTFGGEYRACKKCKKPVFSTDDCSHPDNCIVFTDGKFKGQEQNGKKHCVECGLDKTWDERRECEVEGCRNSGSTSYCSVCHFMQDVRSYEACKNIDCVGRRGPVKIRPVSKVSVKKRLVIGSFKHKHENKDFECTWEGTFEIANGSKTEVLFYDFVLSDRVRSWKHEGSIKIMLRLNDNIEAADISIDGVGIMNNRLNVLLNVLPYIAQDALKEVNGNGGNTRQCHNFHDWY